MIADERLPDMTGLARVVPRSPFGLYKLPVRVDPRTQMASVAGSGMPVIEGGDSNALKHSEVRGALPMRSR